MQQFGPATGRFGFENQDVCDADGVNHRAADPVERCRQVIALEEGGAEADRTAARGRR